MPIGTMRSGCGEYHSSKNQSFHACVTASPSSGSRAAREHRAAEAGDLRREVHRRPHAVDVHVADAGVDVVATGAHLVEAGRLDHPVLALAADDGVEPDLEEDLAVELPHLVALFGLDDLRRDGPASFAGRRPSNMPGGSTRWSSMEISVWRMARGSGSAASPCVSLLRQLQPDRSPPCAGNAVRRATLTRTSARRLGCASRALLLDPTRRRW